MDTCRVGELRSQCPMRLRVSRLLRVPRNLHGRQPVWSGNLHQSPIFHELERVENVRRCSISSKPDYFKYSAYILSIPALVASPG